MFIEEDMVTTFGSMLLVVRYQRFSIVAFTHDLQYQLWPLHLNHQQPSAVSGVLNPTPNLECILTEYATNPSFNMSCSHRGDVSQRSGCQDLKKTALTQSSGQEHVEVIGQRQNI